MAHRARLPRNSKTASAWTTSNAAATPAGTATSPSPAWSRHSAPNCAMTQEILMGPAGRFRADENGGAHGARRHRLGLALRDRPKIDAGALTFGCPPVASRTRVSVSSITLRGSAGGMRAALDGIYVLRTSVGPGSLDSGEVVSSCKSLACVERAFRAFNTDLDIRPIRHHTEERVRAHVFLRLLSYYITWHMHDRLAPLLFTDDDKPAAQAAGAAPSLPLPAPRGPWPRPLPSAPQATCRCTASRPCWPTWPPSASTRSSPPTRPCPPSGSSPHPPRSSATPSTCSASATASAPRSQQPAQHHPEPDERAHLRPARRQRIHPIRSHTARTPPAPGHKRQSSRAHGPDQPTPAATRRPARTCPAPATRPLTPQQPRLRKTPVPCQLAETLPYAATPRACRSSSA